MYLIIYFRFSGQDLKETMGVLEDLILYESSDSSEEVVDEDRV